MLSMRYIWNYVRNFSTCKVPPIWPSKFSPPCNIDRCVFTDKPMADEVTKDGVYQNPEYKSYHTFSYLDIQLQLDCCRLEQPVAEETDCRGELVYPKACEPTCSRKAENNEV